MKLDERRDPRKRRPREPAADVVVLDVVLDVRDRSHVEYEDLPVTCGPGARAPGFRTTLDHGATGPTLDPPDHFIDLERHRADEQVRVGPFDRSREDCDFSFKIDAEDVADRVADDPL